MVIIIELEVWPYFKVAQINGWANCPTFQRCPDISSKEYMDIKTLQPCKVNVYFR